MKTLVIHFLNSVKNASILTQSKAHLEQPPGLVGSLRNV